MLKKNRGIAKKRWGFLELLKGQILGETSPKTVKFAPNSQQIVTPFSLKSLPLVSLCFLLFFLFFLLQKKGKKCTLAIKFNNCKNLAKFKIEFRKSLVTVQCCMNALLLLHDNIRRGL